MPFKATQQGHQRADEEITLAMCVGLVKFHKNVNAFPSIQILEDEDLDLRVASNGSWLYLYSKKNDRMYGLKLDQVISGARFHASGGKSTEREKKEPKKIEGATGPVGPSCNIGCPSGEPGPTGHQGAGVVDDLFS